MRKVAVAILISGLFSCINDPLPKPTGYYRIDLPEKDYQTIDSIPFPFRFELPKYATVNLERIEENENFLNIDFNRFGARIHLSYITVDGNLPKLLEDSRTLVYKHTVKAQDIGENLVINKAARVFGTYYQIEGNSASGSQFYLTDSNDHFLRGALYFNVSPNYDSIAPVQEFIKQDIEQMIESFSWKDRTILQTETDAN
jgi:gliding motility-associated lipoprotein GldD